MDVNGSLNNKIQITSICSFGRGVTDIISLFGVTESYVETSDWRLLWSLAFVMVTLGMVLKLEVLLELSSKDLFIYCYSV